jgi:hypothetical protein
MDADTLAGRVQGRSFGLLASSREFWVCLRQKSFELVSRNSRTRFQDLEHLDIRGPQLYYCCLIAIDCDVKSCRRGSALPLVGRKMAHERIMLRQELPTEFPDLFQRSKNKTLIIINFKSLEKLFVLFEKSLLSMMFLLILNIVRYNFYLRASIRK